MAKRQFSSTDTSKWRERFSNGIHGVKTYTTTKTLDSTDYFYNSRITGSVNTKTAPTPDLADGVYNLPCKIVQTQGGGSLDDPNHELNFLISVTGGVATFKYEFTRNWNTGAQVITSGKWRKVIINNGVTLNVPAWDGNKGGEFWQISKELWDNSAGGTVDMRNLGFRGGSGSPRASNNTTNAYKGEGPNGVQTITTGADGPSGGGGGGSADGGPGGGGGGNATTGGTGGSGQGAPGQGGSTTNNVALTIMTFSGSGGGGKGEQNAPNGGGTGGGDGARSPGNFEVIARVINAGNINLNGSNGNGGNVSGAEGSGGGGASAGGNGLFKGERVTLISTVTASQATGGANGGGASGRGGDSSVGRFRVEYSIKATISTSPSASVFQDKLIRSLRGGAGLLMQTNR